MPEREFIKSVILKKFAEANALKRLKDTYWQKNK